METKNVVAYVITALALSLGLGIMTHWIAGAVAFVLAAAGFAAWAEYVDQGNDSIVLVAIEWLKKKAQWVQRNWIVLLWRIVLFMGVLALVIWALRSWPQQTISVIIGVIVMAIAGKIIQAADESGRKDWKTWSMAAFGVVIILLAIGGVVYFGFIYTMPKAAEAPTEETPPAVAKVDHLQQLRDRIKELEGAIGGEFRVEGDNLHLGFAGLPAARKTVVQNKAKSALRKLEEDFGGELTGATITKVVAVELIAEAKTIDRVRVKFLAENPQGLLNQGNPLHVEVILGFDEAQTQRFAEETFNSLKTLPTR